MGSSSTTTLTRIRQWVGTQWKAANKEGGVDEHKQTQSWRPREEDSDEVDERREEQYEWGRTACRGREFQKLNRSQPILIVFYVYEGELFCQYSVRKTVQERLESKKKK